MGPQPRSQTPETMAAKSPVTDDVSIAELRESVEVDPPPHEAAGSDESRLSLLDSRDAATP